jgi:inhibitor of KinA
MELTPLGDQAVLAYFPHENDALRFSAAARSSAPLWVTDIVSSYTTVAVFFDLDRSTYVTAADWMRKTGKRAKRQPVFQAHRHVIPCCYEFQKDLARVAEYSRLSADQVIAEHTSVDYTVYAIGFCPGFPYLGYLPAKLAGIPRLTTPRREVEAGCVGMTGRQTGIYTETRPGGWNIIGRTPLELVNVAEGYFPLRAGDWVRFERIDETAFARLRGERLTATS